MEVWALRLNDIAIVAVSAEPLTELSLEMKSRVSAILGDAGARHTLFLGWVLRPMPLYLHLLTLAAFAFHSCCLLLYCDPPPIAR